MMPQIGSHVGCQVSEAVKGPKGEVKGKSADQSKDTIKFLRREHLRNGRTNSHFQLYRLASCWFMKALFFIEAQELALFSCRCLLLCKLLKTSSATIKKKTKPQCCVYTSLKLATGDRPFFFPS